MRLFEAHLKDVDRNLGDILNRIKFENIVTTRDLVLVSLMELGLSYRTATQPEIYSVAKCHGLSLCPAEVALQLWLTYPNMLHRGESISIAMDPVVDSKGNEVVFALERNDYGEGFLVTKFHDWISTWNGGQSIVFVRK